MIVRRATAEDAVETWRDAYRGLLPDDVVAGFDVEERRRLWREGLSRLAAPRQ